MSDNNWLDELSNLAVGGRFIPSAEGLVVSFQIIDLSERPTLVDKKYEGKEFQKYQWNVIFKGSKWHKDAYKEILEDKKDGEKKIKNIEALEEDAEYILELSKTATKQLSAFILEAEISEKDTIKFIRIGTSNDTEYKFKKLE
jgi:hypothetical protein